MSTKLPREIRFAPMITFKQIKGEGKQDQCLGNIFYPSAEEATAAILAAVERIETLCPKGYEPDSCQILVSWNEPFRVSGEIHDHPWHFPKEKLELLGAG